MAALTDSDDQYVKLDIVGMELDLAVCLEYTVEAATDVASSAVRSRLLLLPLQ